MDNGRSVWQPLWLSMEPYERFVAWKESYGLVLECYRVTKSFPKYELYGLTSQTRRAAFSVVANLAEGSAKRGRREFRRYLDISIGSLAELSVSLRLARDQEFMTTETWQALEGRRRRASFLVWRLYRSLGQGGR